MIALRALAWLMIFVGCLTLTRDVWGGMTVDHGFHPKAFGDYWNMVSPGAPDNLHAVLIKSYGKWAWWPFGIITETWAFVVLLLPGVLLEILVRPKVDKPGRRLSSEKARFHSR